MDAANPVESDVAIRSHTQSWADDHFHEMSGYTNPIDADSVYRDAAACGFEYGRSLFQQMEQVMSRPSRLVHNIKVPDSSEVSGGTTDTAVPILETLGGAAEEPARFVQYDFTDTCASTLEIPRAKLAPWGGLVSYKTLDLEVSSQDQGFESESYDVVVLGSDDPFDTAFMQRAMAHIRSLFRSGGKLIIIEDTNLNGLVRSLPSSSLDEANNHSYLTNGGDSLRDGDSHLLNGDSHHVDSMHDSSTHAKR